MKQKYYTEQGRISKSPETIIDELIESGAPIFITKKSLTDTLDYEEDEIEFGDNLEVYPDIRGGVTYIWDRKWKPMNKNIEKHCPKCDTVFPLVKFRLRNKKYTRTHANVDSYCETCRDL